MRGLEIKGSDDCFSFFQSDLFYFRFPALHNLIHAFIRPDRQNDYLCRHLGLIIGGLV